VPARPASPGCARTGEPPWPTGPAGRRPRARPLAWRARASRPRTTRCGARARRRTDAARRRAVRGSDSRSVRRHRRGCPARRG
jgi:hypothetical protein